MTELSAVVRFVQIVAAVVLSGSFAFNLLIARSAVEKAGIGIDGRDILNLRFHRQIVIWSIFVPSVSALLNLRIQSSMSAIPQLRHSSIGFTLYLY